MQTIQRKSARHPKHESQTGWTANSDLFMGIAILFLIMFVFALLSSGASQIAVQKEKIDAQKYLLAQIPESQKSKTAQEMEDAASDLKEMAAKRELLQMSLSQLAQLAESMERRESSINQLYARQNENEAVIKRSQDMLAERESQLKSQSEVVAASEAQRQRLTDEVVAKDKALSQLRSQLDDEKAARVKDLGQKAALSQDMQAKAAALKALELSQASAQKQLAALKSENESLSTSNESLKDQVQALSQDGKGQQDELKQLRASVEKLQKEKAELEGKNQGLAKANADLKSEGEALSSALGQEKSKNGALEGNLKAMGAKLAGLEGEHKGLEGKYKDSLNALGEGQGKLKAMEGSLGEMGGQLKQRDNELANVKRAKDDLEKRLAVVAFDKKALADEGKRLADNLAALQNEKTSLAKTLDQGKKAQIACEEEKDKTKAEQAQLAALAKDQAARLNDASANINAARQVVSDVDNERKKIAEGLIKNLKASGVDVDINPETGNITLRMDESFYFQNASFELREEAKQKIAKILPVYASSLLGTPQIAKRIESIHVTGYASPKFKKEYIDPSNAEGEAYDYNLELSVSRAREIVMYMLGGEIPAYPYRDQMRKMVNVSGMGLMKSIPHESDSICLKDPDAAKKLEECSCGPFDCKKSRRVEIQFVLKNQKDTDRQLQKISEKLKFAGAENVRH